MTPAVKRRLLLGVKIALAVGVVTWLLRSDGLDFSKLGKLEDRWQWFLLAQVPFGFVL